MSAAQKTILLVEDDVDTSNVISTILRRRGYTVLVAADYETGLKLGREQPFDLLLSDIGLPDGTGLDLIGKLHEEKSFPAIAVSGFCSDKDVENGIGAGFNEYLCKPYQMPDLLERIKRLLAIEAL